MNMNEVIARINALAKKAKEGPLTEKEQAEREAAEALQNAKKGAAEA